MVRKSRSRTDSASKRTKTKGVKKRISKKHKARSNPKRGKALLRKGAQTPRKKTYYRVRDDAKIMDFIKKHAGVKTKSDISKCLAKELKHSVESVRDRIKRYINKLSPADQKEIQKVARRHPEYYVHFKKMGEVYRRINKIDKREPSLFNKPQKSSKKTKKRTPKPNKYSWIASKLKDKDPYFSVDHGVQLLSCILLELLDQGVSQSKVNSLLEKTNEKMNLDEIFKKLGFK